MSNQYQEGFFEFISAADAEKVHSQTIGWIFSKECDVFDRNQKSMILNDLISSKDNKREDFCPKKVNVEVYDIDILIETSDHLIIIENKIKSSQHSNQLFKYEYITANNLESALEAYKLWKSIKFPKDNFIAEYIATDLEGRKKLKSNWETEEKIKLNDLNLEIKGQFQNKKLKYIYLTLVKEKPESDKWISVTYSELHKVLTKYLIKNDRQISGNHSIVASYLSTIKNLSNITESFIANPSKYDFVFKEGKIPKGMLQVDGLVRNPEKSYIKKLQLETLLQKCFYTGILEKIKEKIKANNLNLLNNVECNIQETRGTALLDFVFEKIKLGQMEYSPILQFQGSSIKLALAGSQEAESKGGLGIEFVKKKFAKKLSQSQDFLTMYPANSINEKQILSGLSSPKSENGFFSINLNKKGEFWQLNNNPENFVEDKIEMAKKIFKGLKD
jgi:hypothetical protein